MGRTNCGSTKMKPYQRQILCLTYFFFPVKVEILNFSKVEISTGNTLEISDKIRYSNLGENSFFNLIFRVKKWFSPELSTMLPPEISALKNIESELPLEKKITAKEQKLANIEPFLVATAQNSQFLLHFWRHSDCLDFQSHKVVFARNFYDVAARNFCVEKYRI